MIIKCPNNEIDGRIFCGETFSPSEGNKSYAKYERNGLVCAVFYETGHYYPFLRFMPGYQLPPFARDKQAWIAHMWNCEDDRAIEIKLDESDGELSFIYNEDDVDENLEEIIEDTLNFLLDPDFYGEVVDFVQQCIC